MGEKAWLRFSYADVKKQFEGFYWADGKHGNVAGERWLLPAKQLKRLSRRAKLAIFTGRTRAELSHTLERFDMRRYFSTIVTVESISKPKPDPEGLLQILDGLPASKAVYLATMWMTPLRRRRLAWHLSVCCRGEAWSAEFARGDCARWEREQFWERLLRSKIGWLRRGPPRRTRRRRDRQDK